MPWYQTSEGELIVREQRPPRSLQELQEALQNTLEQAAKESPDPEREARLLGSVLYEKGALSVPVGSLKELLDLVLADDRMYDYLGILGPQYPLESAEEQDLELRLIDWAVMF